MPEGNFYSGGGDDGYGDDSFGDDGYGGTSTLSNATSPPGSSGAGSRSPLGCRGAAHVTLHFQESGMVIKPLSFDARQTYMRDDYFRAKVHREAASHMEDHIVNLEPVVVRADGQAFYKGFVRSDSATVGHKEGSVEVYDPLKILENGYVDREWQKVELTEIAEYIYDQAVDPHGVLNGLRVTDDGGVKYQHDNLTTRAEPLLGIQDGIREFFNIGDGNFDFRGETPRKALQQISNVYNFMIFTDEGQNLTLGFPDQIATMHEAGRRDQIWRMRDFNVPLRQDPFGKVIVKGYTPMFGNGETGGGSSLLDWANLPIHFLSQAMGTNLYAYAKMDGYDGEPTLMEYTKSNNADTLKNVARGMIIKKYQENNSGTVTIDVLASNTGMDDLTGFKVGDYLTTEENPRCKIRGDTFRVNGIRHQWGPDVGWKMTVDVVGLIPEGSISTGTAAFEASDPNTDGFVDTIGGDFMGDI